MIWVLSGACAVLLWLVASAHWRINQQEARIAAVEEAMRDATRLARATWTYTAGNLAARLSHDPVSTDKEQPWRH